MKTISGPHKLKISRVWIEHKVDEHPDLSYLDSDVIPPACKPAYQYKRMESYYAGNWHMIGIIAKAEIISAQSIIQTLRSGGLWSIESDSGEEYLKSIEDEQLQELRAELLALGIGERQIQHSFKNVERKD